MNEMVKTFTIMLLLSFIAGSTLGFIKKVTLKPIEYQKIKYVKGPAVLAVLEGGDNNPLKDYQRVILDSEDDKSEIRKDIFPAYKNGQCIAVSFEVTGNGYGGKLMVMVGISLVTGNLTGIRVMTHSETPGLGSLALEPGFYDQFSGKASSEITLIVNGGSIDSISGATKTSNAVTDSVRKATLLFKKNKEHIVKLFKEQLNEKR